VSREVELKLALDPADAKRLRKAAPLKRARARVKRMDGIYLDTADSQLARHGMALRLRTDGERWMQCLKAGASGAGGLHSRGEWEFEQEQRLVDLACFRETPLAALEDTATLHKRLHGAFRVTFDRTTWELRPSPGSRLEVALDIGHVAAADATEPICEVEIECVEGGAGAAFDLAEALMDTVTLRPSSVTKARRGYRLFRGEALRPVKAHASRVEAAMTPGAAARAIVAGALEQLQANEEGVLASGDPEFVHQARVALRRMRSALRIFARPIGEERAGAWRSALGRATRSLGAARDWDVFVTETLPALPAGPQVVERARQHQARARRRARKAIRSRAYALAILHVSRWLAEGDAAKGAGKLHRFAARRLDKRHARLVEGLAGLASASVEERHRTRIDAKRLRYVVEGLAPALDARAARRYARMLSRLQDALGRANDAVTGRRLLATLRPPAGLAAFAHDWLAARIADEAGSVEGLARDITHMKPFWRDA
jgi:inorganic triphosphatase YgiF